MTEDAKTTRCTECESEFSEKEVKNTMVCPKCGTDGIPCAIADDVTIKINWHELRILGIWASNFASKKDFSVGARKALATIIRRLERQFPDKTPLTLAGEVQQLQETYPSMELRDGEGNVTVPKKKVQ